MKTAEEILKPYVEVLFRHTEIVEKENALLAMEEYARQCMEEFKDSLKPKTNIWGVSKEYLDGLDLTKGAGQRD